MTKGIRLLILPIAFVAISVALPIDPGVSGDAPRPAESQEESSARKDCVSYEPGDVILKGQLHRTALNLVLELSDPICINQRGSEEALYPLMTEVKTILFLHREDDWTDTYSGKEVLVTGTLYHKYNDSGEGSIIMRATHIELAQ